MGRYVLGTSRKGISATSEIRLCNVNGQIGVLVIAQGRPTNVIVPEIADGQIHALRTVRNPDKLGHVEP